MSGTEPCPICRGIGYVTLDVPPGHPDFARVLTCECRQGEVEARRSRRLLQLSRLGGLAEHTFDSFQPEGVALNADDQRNLRRAYDVARDFAAAPRGWLLITGTYGSGKTHLAAAITVELVGRGHPVLFQVVPDLLDHLRAAYAPDSEEAFDQVFLDVREAPVLILDDLGAQNSTPWAMEKLYQILNTRYNNRMPTVITSNAALEDLDPRLRSRLTDEALVLRVAITAPDFRGSGSVGVLGDLGSLSFHADKTFDTFDSRARELDPDSRDHLQAAFSAAQEFAAAPSGFLLLQGDHYSGKTHLAAAIANQRLAEGSPALFVETSDLLDFLRAAYEPTAAVSLDKRLQQIRRAPLLVLDNLGGQSSSAWSHEKLFQLLSYRLNAHLPTVITTSQTLEEIEPRLRVRFMDKAHCVILPIVVPPYRRLSPRRTRSRRPG